MQNSLRHLNALRAFEAAARHSSFAKAAIELNVSHSVVSQHVKNLEGWFGTELFIRHGNRIELSDDGRAFVPHIANGFQILRDACDGLLRSSHQGTITISAEPALASRWLRRRMTQFSKEHPNLDVDIRPAWKPPILGEDQADIIIHFENRIPSIGTTNQRLFSIEGFPACSPDLAQSITLDGGTANFTGLPLIHDNGRQIWHQWFVDFLPDSNQWEEGKIYSDFSLAIDAAVDGEGIILADEVICGQELTNGRLVRLDNRVIHCAWYSLATEKHKPLHPSIITLRDWLVASG